MYINLSDCYTELSLVATVGGVDYIRLAAAAASAAVSVAAGFGRCWSARKPHHPEHRA